MLSVPSHVALNTLTNVAPAIENEPPDRTTGTTAMGMGKRIKMSKLTNTAGTSSGKEPATTALAVKTTAVKTV